MIHSRHLIPKELSRNSRDIHVFLRLLDVVANNSKSKSDNFVNILTPEKCPNKLLPLLASYLGYEYDYTETFDHNRTILTSYGDLIRNRGSRKGIELAVSVAISMVNNKSISDTQDLFEITYYNYKYTCEDCRYVSYVETGVCPACGSTNLTKSEDKVIVANIGYPIYSGKIHDLIETVRPAGIGFTAYNGTITSNTETLEIYDYINLQSNLYNLGRSDVGGKDSDVGFAELLQDDSITRKYCPNCETLYNTDQVDSKCIYCGESLIDDMHTDIKLLYRLYNDNRSMDSIVHSLFSVTDKDKVVGLIVRFHYPTDHNPQIVCKLIGVKPYLDLTDSSTSEYKNEYTLEEILDRISEVNDNFKSDEPNSYYVLEQKITESDGTTVINNTKYHVDMSNCTIMSRYKIEDTDEPTGESSYIHSITSGESYNFMLGTDTLADKDIDITSPTELSTIEHHGYMNVCASCGSYIESDDYVNICPYCGGYRSTENQLSSAEVPYIPAILRGSYILDLYLTKE